MSMSIDKRHDSRGGFTFIEMMVALGIISLAIFSLLQVQVSTNTLWQRSYETQTAVFAARELVTTVELGRWYEEDIHVEGDWSEELFLGEESFIDEAMGPTQPAYSARYPGFSWVIDFEEFEDERVFKADLAITGPSRKEYRVTWLIPFIDGEYVEEEEDSSLTGATGK